MRFIVGEKTSFGSSCLVPNEMGSFLEIVWVVSSLTWKSAHPNGISYADASQYVTHRHKGDRRIESPWRGVPFAH